VGRWWWANKIRLETAAKIARIIGTSHPVLMWSITHQFLEASAAEALLRFELAHIKDLECVKVIEMSQVGNKKKVFCKMCRSCKVASPFAAQLWACRSIWGTTNMA